MIRGNDVATDEFQLICLRFRFPMGIPTKQELVSHDSLDEKFVVEHFLGRSAEEAYEMYRTDGILYAEDLMWMAEKGLTFYLAPALKYIQSADSVGDLEFVSGVLTSLSFQICTYRVESDLAELAGAIASYSRANLTKFDSTDDDSNILKQVNEIESGLANLTGFMKN